MHAPDGFLTAATAISTGVLSAGLLGLAARKAGDELDDKQIPLAGLAAAFIFAGQMVNFPVAAGTSGHLLGGALAAILLGPGVGALVVAIVVVVQALVFADGGLTALGYNTLNMAIVPAFGGYAVFTFARKFLPSTAGGVVGATGLAALASVVLSATAFSIEWLFGAAAPVPFDTVFGAMVSVHLLIGIGEAVISAMVVSAVLAARPDLVVGARDLDRAALASTRKVPMRAFVVGTLVVSLGVATVISQFASGDPDGLERVAEDEGFVDTAEDHALGNSVFADYATSGVGNEGLSLAVAGAGGTLLTLAVGYGVFRTVAGGTDRRSNHELAA